MPAITKLQILKGDIKHWSPETGIRFKKETLLHLWISRGPLSMDIALDKSKQLLIKKNNRVC